MKIDIEKTIKNAVPVEDEFPFYVEELSANGEMPTLMGLADEKYSFGEMDDDFFEFIQRKVNENGVYIRLIHITEKRAVNGSISLEIEAGQCTKTLEVSQETLYEVSDFGIKIEGDEITCGRTVFCENPRFEKLDENDFLSRLASEIIEDLIFFD